MTAAAARDEVPMGSPAHARRLSRAGRLFRRASSSPALSRSTSSPASDDDQSGGTERICLCETTHLSVAFFLAYSFAQSIAASEVLLLQPPVLRARCWRSARDTANTDPAARLLVSA